MFNYSVPNLKESQRAFYTGGIKKLLRKMLDNDPTQRPTTTEALAELEKWPPLPNDLEGGLESVLLPIRQDIDSEWQRVDDQMKKKK